MVNQGQKLPGEVCNLMGVRAMAELVSGQGFELWCAQRGACTPLPGEPQVQNHLPAHSLISLCVWLPFQSVACPARAWASWTGSWGAAGPCWGSGRGRSACTCRAPTSAGAPSSPHTGSWQQRTAWKGKSLPPCPFAFLQAEMCEFIQFSPLSPLKLNFSPPSPSLACRWWVQCFFCVKNLKY